MFLFYKNNKMKFSITIDDFIEQSKEKFDDRYCYDNMKLYKVIYKYKNKMTLTFYLC